MFSCPGLMLVVNLNTKAIVCSSLVLLEILLNGGRGSRSSATVVSAIQCFLLFVLCREEANVLKAKVVLSTKDFVTAAPLGQVSGCTIRPRDLGLSLLGCGIWSIISETRFPTNVISLYRLQHNQSSTIWFCQSMRNVVRGNT